MWLLNAQSEHLEYFGDEMLIYKSYAILSHTWGENEVTFQEMMHFHKGIRSKQGYAKIKHVRQQAIKDKLKYVWVDTCCIDKSSSAELSEAINSMYKWYRNAKICYAYLVDVAGDCPCLDDIPVRRELFLRSDNWMSQFAFSRWHKRSWTLQELIAPQVMRFYGSKWNYIGSKGHESEHASLWSEKKYLRPLLSHVTNIDALVLEDSAELRSMSVAKKMMWASQRSASRVEDQAYSMMGIFKVNMPLLYGEGRNSLTRLMHEVARTSNDLSILAWLPKSNPSDRLLASSFQYFQGARNIVRTTKLLTSETFDVTPGGIRIKAPIVRQRLEYGTTMTWIVLNCRYDDDLSGPMALRCSFRDPSMNVPETFMDPNEYYEASLALCHDARLKVLNAEECRGAQMQNLLLTHDVRASTQDVCINALPSFWFKLKENPHREFLIVDTDPDMDWNYQTGVLCPKSRDALDTHVTIMTPAQTQIRLHITFTSNADFWRSRHRVLQQDSGYQMVLDSIDRSNCEVPGLFLSLPADSLHVSCGNIAITSGELVSVELEKQVIMGTLVFIVKLSLIEDEPSVLTPNGSDNSAASLAAAAESVQIAEYADRNG